MKRKVKFLSVILTLSLTCALTGCSGSSDSIHSSDASIVSDFSSFAERSQTENDSATTIQAAAEQFLRLYISTNKDVAKQQQEYHDIVTSSCYDKLYSKFDRPDESAPSSSTVATSISDQSTFVKQIDAATAQTLSVIYVRADITLPTGKISNNEPYLTKLKLVQTDKWRVDDLVCETSLYAISDLPMQDLLS